MQVKVKICGISNLADAEFAAAAGADYLGFIFYPPSPRSITVEAAAAIAAALRRQQGRVPSLVGVFVNENAASVNSVCEQVGLDMVQLSGEERPSDLPLLLRPSYKALQPPSLAAAQALAAAFLRDNGPHPALLLDSYHPNLRGGTGELGDPAVVAALRRLSPRLMLAGGLRPENVAAQVAAFQPFAVDVASGVEATKGKKDPAKVRQFIEQAKSVQVMETPL